MDNASRPYLKPLSLRPEGSIFQTDVSLAELNGVPGRGPLPVRLVVFAPVQAGSDLAASPALGW